LPHRRKGLLDVDDCRTLNNNPGVAPWFDVAVWIPRPVPADAQTCDKGDAAVHGKHLSMIATQPAKRAVQSGWVETTHLNSRVPQRFPEPERRRAKGAKPVVDQPHPHTLARLGSKGIGELLAYVVSMNDIALEVNVPVGRLDRIQPCRVVFSRIPEDAHPVPRDQGSSRCPGKSLVCQSAKLRNDIAIPRPGSRPACSSHGDDTESRGSKSARRRSPRWTPIPQIEESQRRFLAARSASPAATVVVASANLNYIKLVTPKR
jgi:hypothetical protein